MVFHLDENLMKDLTEDEKADRFSILVFGSGIDQLLIVPKLPSGTCKAMADAVIEVLSVWGIKDRIKDTGFGTTSSNAGRKNYVLGLVLVKVI
jgi:hypothetical protein